MQIEFSKRSRGQTDAEGGEITPTAIWDVFQDEYLPNPTTPGAASRSPTARPRPTSTASSTLTVDATVDGAETTPGRHRQRPDLGVLPRALQGVGIDVRLLDYQEHKMS